MKYDYIYSEAVELISAKKEDGHKFFTSDSVCVAVTENDKLFSSFNTSNYIEGKLIQGSSEKAVVDMISSAGESKIAAMITMKCADMVPVLPDKETVELITSLDKSNAAADVISPNNKYIKLKDISEYKPDGDNSGIEIIKVDITARRSGAEKKLDFNPDFNQITDDGEKKSETKFLFAMPGTEKNDSEKNNQDSVYRQDDVVHQYQPVDGRPGVGINPAMTMMSNQYINQSQASVQFFNQSQMNPQYMQPDMMNPQYMQPDMMNQQYMQPGMMNQQYMQPGMMNQQYMQPGMMNQQYMQPGMMNQQYMQPGMMNQQYMQPGMMNQQYMQQEEMMSPQYMQQEEMTNPQYMQQEEMINQQYMQPGMMNQQYMQPGMMNQQYMQPGMMNQQYMQPGMMNPQYMQPGMMNPQYMQPGMMNQQYMEPGMMNQQYMQQEVNNPQNFPDSGDSGTEDTNKDK